MNVDFIEYNILDKKTSVVKNRSVTLYKKKCLYCGNLFWADRKKKTFCNRDCSCKQLRSIQDPTEKFFREKISRLRSNARNRGLEFDLTWMDLLNQYKAQNGRCHYTGENLNLTYSTKTHKVCPPNQLSVDRSDSYKGYLKDNIVLCCYNINNFKGDMSMKDFVELLNKIFRKSIKVKVNKKHPDAVMPKFGKPGDAGADLTAISKIENDLYIEYDTGIAIELPPGNVGLIYPRSSLSNYHLVLSNHVGVVDENYRGSIRFRFKKTSDSPNAKYYEIGDKIGQLIIMPYPSIKFEESTELSETIRGAAGFGSSGS